MKDNLVNKALTKLFVISVISTCHVYSSELSEIP